MGFILGVPIELSAEVKEEPCARRNIAFTGFSKYNSDRIPAPKRDLEVNMEYKDAAEQKMVATFAYFIIKAMFLNSKDGKEEPVCRVA